MDTMLMSDPPHTHIHTFSCNSLFLWQKNTQKILVIISRIYKDWLNLQRLTKILSLNETKWNLFFNIVSLTYTHFFHWCCCAWILLVKKVINSRYDIIIWTFQSILTISMMMSELAITYRLERPDIIQIYKSNYNSKNQVMQSVFMQE